MQSNHTKIDTGSFCAGLQKLMDGAYEVIDEARESTLAPTTDNGVIVYFEDLGKLGFQVTNQYKRPTDFLQCLLDMVRVNYEPSTMGTFFLNSNIQFFFDEAQSKQLKLGYGTLISEEQQAFESFFQVGFMPYLHSCGYDESQISTLFAVITTGEGRYNFKLIEEVSKVLDAGFSVNDASGLIANSIDTTIAKSSKTAYAGYCLDPALGNRLRCSVWLLLGGQ